jgi:Uma2 family endonuclease
MAVRSDWYESIPEQITAEEYAQLPEEFCQSIEVIDGHIVKCESPSRIHNRVAFNIAAALKAGRKPSPCYMVENDVDVRITDVPLNLRRPDITVYRCIADDARLYSGDAVLVVEIVSPDSSLKTDTVDKKAVYADAGIPVYLIVFLTPDQSSVEKIEEYWLDPTGSYRLVQLHTRRLVMDNPIAIDVGFPQLTEI